MPLENVSHPGAAKPEISPTHGVPSSQEILEHLNLILSSDAFSGAAGQQRFLRHLVRKHLEGASADLKELSLGVEVFGRGSDFDPRLDPIVRVEASRLRSRLQKYYLGSGADTRVRIQLPRGGYVPAFSYAQPEEPPAASGPQPSGPFPGATVPATSAESGPATVLAPDAGRSSAKGMPPSSPASPAGLSAGYPVPGAGSSMEKNAVAPAAESAVDSLASAPAARPVPSIQPATPSADQATPERIPARPASSTTLSRWGLAGAVAILFGGGVLWYATHHRPAPPPFRFERFRRVTADQARSLSPTFSPDGTKLFYASRTDDHWQLFERDLKTLAAHRISTGDPSDDTQPALSPDGKRVVFRSERNGGGLFLLELKSGKVTQLTHEGYNPAWSPDGHYVAFSTETFTEPSETSASNRGSLSVVHVPTGKVRQFGTSASNGFEAVQPVWSPNGRRIAFWAINRKDDRDIWTVAVKEDGTPEAAPVAVTQDPWVDWSPAWSPDGQSLYFSSDRGGAMNLWRVHIDEGTGAVHGPPEPVTTPSTYSGWASFAPDGQHLAYVRRVVSSRLYRIPITGDLGLQMDDRVALTSGDQRVREPEVSPDGTQLVVRIQDPQEDIALVRPDGRGLRRLTNDSFIDRSPHWSPDGTRISFMSNRSGGMELWTIKADGTDLRQATQGGSVSSAWTPDGILMAYPQDRKPYPLEPANAQPSAADELPAAFRPMAWSPNGRSIAGRMRTSAFARAALFIYTPSNQDYWQVAASAPYPSTIWLHDGHRLLFSQGDGVYVADVAVHQVKPFLPRSKDQLHSRFALSKDEKTFFFVLSNDEEDIWVASAEKTPAEDGRE